MLGCSSEQNLLSFSLHICCRFLHEQSREQERDECGQYDGVESVSSADCDLNILLLNEWMFDHMNNSIGAHHVRAIDVDSLAVPYYRVACVEEKNWSRKDEEKIIIITTPGLDEI